MLAAFIYLIRKIVRIGFPFSCLSAGVALFGWYISVYWISVVAVGILCAFIGVYGICISIIWSDSSQERERREIRESIREVQIHRAKRREEKLLEAKGRSGQEPPSIYSEDKEGDHRFQ